MNFGELYVVVQKRKMENKGNNKRRKDCNPTLPLAKNYGNDILRLKLDLRSNKPMAKLQPTPCRLINLHLIDHHHIILFIYFLNVTEQQS